MQNLDIPFTDADYQLLTYVDDLLLIYPHEHALSKTIQIDTVVRALSLTDSEYGDLLSNVKKVTEITPLDGRLFEVAYLRECRVEDITSREWKNNYGPRNLQDYLRLVPAIQRDSFVKVINLRTPSYSLRRFNRKYAES